MAAVLSLENQWDWFTHVLEWWKHKASLNILYVKYEDMKTDPLT